MTFFLPPSGLKQSYPYAIHLLMLAVFRLRALRYGGTGAAVLAPGCAPLPLRADRKLPCPFFNSKFYPQTILVIHYVNGYKQVVFGVAQPV